MASLDPLSFGDSRWVNSLLDFLDSSLLASPKTLRSDQVRDKVYLYYIPSSSMLVVLE